ncbi:hypothetical protein Mgra_00003769 [Meloidogyne graminicola]|uniref:Uncharacterized protein n=1 Tax=Meloidogyne graminicola TaxID=189291 RepID=A0A8S9ZU74_9BILA|nr:hypothetical protein Mgra_00003769 [Meloidogyne graminicola]
MRIPIIIQNKIIVKIEWRNNKSKIPEFLYNKLKSKENNRFKLQLSKQMMKTGLIENINLFTKKYDVCMFEDATLLTDYSLPIEQQINNKYYLTIKTYSGEKLIKQLCLKLNFKTSFQILTNYLITGFNKIVKINLSGITNIEVSDYTKENALEIIRPLRILKFIVNKFENNLKLIITCKYEKIHLKFLLMEFNYYYESIHYERHVCPDNEYLIKIEQIEAHNQIKIPFNCDEAINEGRIENKYLINFDWNNYKNNGFKSPVISCTLFDQQPIIIENEQIKDDIKIINQLNKTLINEKSSDSKGKSSILNNYNNITEENKILNEYIKKRNKLKTYQEIYGGNDFEYKGTNSAKGIVEEAIKQIISSRNLREMKPLFKQSNICKLNI